MTARDDDPGIGHGGFAGSPMPHPAELPAPDDMPGAAAWAALKQDDFRRFHLNAWPGVRDADA